MTAIRLETCEFNPNDWSTAEVTARPEMRRIEGSAEPHYEIKPVGEKQYALDYPKTPIPADPSITRIVFVGEQFSLTDELYPAWYIRLEVVNPSDSTSHTGWLMLEVSRSADEALDVPSRMQYRVEYKAASIDGGLQRYEVDVMRSFEKTFGTRNFQLKGVLGFRTRGWVKLSRIEVYRDRTAPICYGDAIQLQHVISSKLLGSLEASYTHGDSSHQQMVLCREKADSSTVWIVRGPNDTPLDYREGNPVVTGNRIRLIHAVTGMALHSHSGHRSPVTREQEVTGYGPPDKRDPNDDWQVRFERNPFVLPGSSLQLKHVFTGMYLRSQTDKIHPTFTHGEQEVACSPLADDNANWICKPVVDRPTASVEQDGSETPHSETSETEPTPISRFLHFERNASEDSVALYREQYAAAIADVFRSAEDDFSFGLLGHWGRGKSFLMERVGQLLVTNHNYQVVKFSAWAYPNTPSLWAHLYEKIAELAVGRPIEGIIGPKISASVPTFIVNPTRKLIAAVTRDSFRVPELPSVDFPVPVRFARIFRTAVVRYGVAPLTIAIALFAIGLFPKYAIVKIIFSTLGVAGIFFTIRAIVSGRRLSTEISRFFTVRRHDEKLGLQASIGKDLHALLVAWMPTRPTKPTDRKRRNLVEPLNREFHWTRTSFYFFTCASVGFSIAYSLDVDALVGSLICGGTAAVGGIPWGLARFCAVKMNRPTRVLLYVDDLDRCEPLKMLEVMEGLKQFLESSNVGRRLQVAMLVDETALAHAILKKYGDLACTQQGCQQRLSAQQIVNENVEKLFLAFLRLSRIGEGEVSELARKMVSRMSGREITSREFAQLHQAQASRIARQRGLTPQKEDEDAPEETGQDFPISEQANVNESVQTNSATTSSDVEHSLTRNEAIALIGGSQELASVKELHIGPRTIRSFVFRYELARNLLCQLGQLAEPSEIIQGLLRCDQGHEPDTGSATLKAIVRQVSWEHPCDD